MEVHHKHHLPKKFNEYITEFLMLFTAVTLGFFAENYREHYLVEKKMHENYQSLIEDLKADSTKMTFLIDASTKGNKTMTDLTYLLYRYHSGKIGFQQLLGEYKKLDELPTYKTVFINNTTFKNIQSSGMLSYISSRDLRFEISYYYEVMFKQLQDNNAIFDQVGMEFFGKNLPLARVSRGLKIESGSDKRADYEAGFLNPDQYLDFMLSFPESHRILKSKKLVYQTEVYHQRYLNYTEILRYMLEKNQILLQKLRKLQAD